jgi:hypothetical protein
MSAPNLLARDVLGYSRVLYRKIMLAPHDASTRRFDQVERKSSCWF